MRALTAWLSRRIPLTVLVVAGQAWPLVVGSSATHPNSFADDGRQAYDAAKAQFSSGRYDEALAAFAQVQMSFPEFAADAQRMIGACYQWKREYGAAIGAYGRLLTVYPGT